MRLRRRTREHLPRESGETLIEVLVAVVIMGIAFVVIIGGIGTAIIGADVQKQQAGTDVALRSAAETITYLSCPGTGDPDYEAQLGPVDGFLLEVTSVSYWNEDRNAFESGPCLDSGLQLIRLSATSTGPGRQATDSLDVVKRRP